MKWVKTVWTDSTSLDLDPDPVLNMIMILMRKPYSHLQQNTKHSSVNYGAFSKPVVSDLDFFLSADHTFRLGQDPATDLMRV